MTYGLCSAFFVLMMSLLRFVLLLFSLLSIACGGQSSSGDAAAPGAEKETPGLHFRMATSVVSEGAGNWCDGNFSETVVVYPDKANPKLRFFVPAGGVYKVIVRHSSGVATFMLRRGAGQAIELYNSANLPKCLSRQQSFILASDGKSFRYEGQTGVNFKVGLQPYQDWTRVDLEYPPDAAYGLMVLRCAECR